MRRTPFLVLFFVAVLGATAVPAQAAAPDGRPSPRAPQGRGIGHGPGKAGTAPAPAFATDKVLVRFASPASKARVVEEHGLRPERDLGVGGFEVVATNGRAADTTRAALRRDPRVEAVELDYVRRATAVPNDTFYAQFQKSYLATAGFERAWDVVKSSSAQKIAIVDSGVDLDHPDLVDRLLPGTDVFGVGDSNPQDENGHGTMVAGMAGASTGNSRGIAGASWGASIVPVRALGPDGSGFDSDIVEGIRWAVDNGATIVNLSLGGPDTSPALDAAVQYAVDGGAVVVAAAGNDGTGQPFYPAAHPSALAVGATDDSGALTYFSNYGPWIDIAAPGRNVAGTACDEDPVLDCSVESYAFGPGTSFASPLVAAAAALVRTQQPGLNVAGVVGRLKSTAADRGPAGIDDFYGWGFLDVGAAVGQAAGASVAPAAGDVAEPNGTPARATALAVGGAATGTISPEGDEDWYSVDVVVPGRLKLTLTPTVDSQADRFALDGIIDVYGPGGNDIGYRDNNGTDMGEVLTVDAATAGRYLVRVANYHGSVSPQYTLSVATTSDALHPDAFNRKVWVQDTSIPSGAGGVALSPALTVTFAPAMDATSFTASTVQLVDGRTGAAVAATRSWNSGTRVLTVTPTSALSVSHPYHLRVGAVEDSADVVMPTDHVVYFTTTDSPPTTTTTTVPPTTTTVPPTTTTVPPTTTTTTAPPPPPAPPARSGYWMADAAGHVYGFGDSQHYGALNGARGDVVDIEPTNSGNGYWLLTSRGEIFAYGNAAHAGQPGGLPADERVTAMSANPAGGGYWVFTSKGRVMPFGGAPFHGHMLGASLNGPVLDSVATPSGRGYYMVASDGGIFAFGDAVFRGSMGGHRLNAPVQSLVPDGDNDGYWLVASDGGVFAFSAGFKGSMGSSPLNRPITGMVRFGDGYLMVGEDGGIFNFSSKPFHGSLGSNPPATPVVAVAALDR